MRERLNQEKKERLLDELHVARKRQFQEREARMADQAAQEKDEFFRVIIEQKENENKERRIQQ